MYVLEYYNAEVDASEQSGTLPLIDGSIIAKILAPDGGEGTLSRPAQGPKGDAGGLGGASP